MGFWKKLGHLVGIEVTGGPNKTQKLPVAPTQMQATRPAGEVGTIPGRIEADETESRIVQCEQMIFSKLVKVPGGEIHRSGGYTNLGSTPNFSTTILNKWRDAHTTFEKIDRPTYPFKGAIEKRIVQDGGAYYVVCTKADLRRDAGKDDKGSRFHTRERILAIPIEEWSIALIPQLDRILDMEELENMTEKKVDKMPHIPVSTEILNESLPRGWFDEDVKDLLFHVLSGKDISFEETTTEPSEFLRRLYYALLCLPEDVSRSVSFGAGLGSNEDPSNRMRISHTMRGCSSIVKKGGKWTGESDVKCINFGTSYLQQLVSCGVQNCKTPRDIMKVVKSLPPEVVSKVTSRIFRG